MHRDAFHTRIHAQSIEVHRNQAFVERTLYLNHCLCGAW